MCGELRGIKEGGVEEVEGQGEGRSCGPRGGAGPPSLKDSGSCAASQNLSTFGVEA